MTTLPPYNIRDFFCAHTVHHNDREYRLGWDTTGNFAVIRDLVLFDVRGFPSFDTGVCVLSDRQDSPHIGFYQIEQAPAITGTTFFELDIVTRKTRYWKSWTSGMSPESAFHRLIKDNAFIVITKQSKM